MTDAQRDPTRELAEFVVGLDVAAVPTDVTNHAKDLLLDVLACALAADQADETRMFNNLVDAVGGDGPSTVVGDVRTRDLASAVLLNGFRAAAITACDVYAPADLHTTPEIVPPVIALAEREGSTGAEVLGAVIAGLEVLTRLARGFDYPEFRRRGWHSPGVVGPLGAAAASASILGMGADAATNALAVAGSTAAGTWAASSSPTVKFHQSRAALTGFLSAMLANEGFTGSSAIVTHEQGGLFVAYAPGDPDAVVSDLGREWELQRISLRLWPGGARLQPSMTATRRILDEDPVEWGEIESVAVKVAPAMGALQTWAARPRGTFAALASIPYAVAVTLRYGSPSVEHFGAASYEDPEITAFLDRITVEGDAGVPALGATVEVTTRDGTLHTASVETPKGHPRSPASRDELAAKVRRSAPVRMQPELVEELIERVRGIEREPNLARILELVRV
ncbi:MAG TPA: MmgE/PrpD family protein [Candidatus Limnocylindria bacterium]